MRFAESERGAASVEHVGLMLLVALLALAAIASLTASGPPERATHLLAGEIARKMRCAVRAPKPCWQDALTEAYGRPLAGAVRALAPAPATRDAPMGDPELPVDFRYCRSSSCAAPGTRDGLTASNRRVSVFASVLDHRPGGGDAEISYWLYRPGLAWERIVRRVSSDQVRALAPTPLLDTDVPRLVPLETLDGRDHVRFAKVEEPPWRWQVRSVYP